MDRRMIGVKDHNQRLAAYRATKSDAEAARVCSMSQPGFSMWRRKQGLKSKGKPGGGGSRLPRRSSMVLQRRSRERALQLLDSVGDLLRMKDFTRRTDAQASALELITKIRKELTAA